MDNLPSLGDRFKKQEEQRLRNIRVQTKDIGFGQRISSSSRSLGCGGGSGQPKSLNSNKEDV